MGIDKGQRSGKHDDLTRAIIGVFYEIYNELGNGFLESVYREAMRLALTQIGLVVKTEVPVPVSFRGEVVGTFRADLIVNGAVLVELKSSDAITRQHESQRIHYLRATNIEVALLMNFGAVPQLKRLLLNNNTKRIGDQSAKSVLIRVKPLVAPEVIAWA